MMTGLRANGAGMDDPIQRLGIVYFGNDWNAENRTSSHHVALRLARRTPVLYVDSPGMRAPSGSGRDVRRAVRKLAATFRRPQRVHDGLWHCTVPQLPFRRVPGVHSFNRWFGRWAVKRAMRHVGIRDCISWFVVPHTAFLAGRLGETLCVYYCIDDYAAHPGVDVERIEACDRQLSEHADLLFVAPPALLESKRALNPHTFAAPHGVDVDLFAQATDPATEVPEAARALAAPVIGFHGSLHEWIDLPLIDWLAAQRPGWNFLLVGYAAADVSMLRARSNVHLVGAQPYASLPNWAKAYDVAIIPYRMNRQVANANPLKLREYLATGKPIVSTRNPEIEKFAAWVRIADTREDFLAAIDAILAGEPDGAAAARRAAVADQTWDRRVDAVLATVRDALRARETSFPLNTSVPP